MKNKNLKIEGILVMLFLYICSNANFGDGRDDDTYALLRYVYGNKEFKGKYGDSFEVNDMGGSSEVHTFIFLQLFKGT